MAQAKTTDLTLTGSRTPFALFYVAVLCSAAFRGVQDTLRRSHSLVGSYWAGFYYTSYAGGDRRRALIGSIFSLVHPGGVGLFAITIFALAVLCSIYFLFVNSLLRSEGGLTLKQRYAHLLILGGVLVSIQWEVLGDLLQIDLLIFLLVLLGLCRFVRNINARVAMMLLLMVPLTAIHEAALFIFPPFIPYVRERRPVLRDFALPALVAVALLGASMVLGAGTSEHLSRSSTAVGSLAQAVPDRTPPFSILMREELHHDFGTVRAVASWVSRILRIVSLLLASVFVCVMARYFRASGFVQTAWRALVFSVPLWLIAHDWGRFLSYTIVLSLFVEGTLLARTELPTMPRWLSAFARLKNDTSAWLAAVAILLLGAGHEARVAGMDLRGFLAAVPVLMVTLWHLLRSPQLLRAPAGSIDQANWPAAVDSAPLGAVTRTATYTEGKD